MLRLWLKALNLPNWHLQPRIADMLTALEVWDRVEYTLLRSARVLVGPTEAVCNELHG